MFIDIICFFLYNSKKKTRGVQSTCGLKEADVSSILPMAYRTNSKINFPTLFRWV